MFEWEFKVSSLGRVYRYEFVVLGRGVYEYAAPGFGLEIWRFAVVRSSGIKGFSCRECRTKVCD